jgi:hypothetical protein
MEFAAEELGVGGARIAYFVIPSAVAETTDQPVRVGRLTNLKEELADLAGIITTVPGTTSPGFDEARVILKAFEVGAVTLTLHVPEEFGVTVCGEQVNSASA